MERRRFMRLVGAASAASVAGMTGCLNGNGGDYVEVTAGPEGRWAFEPEEVEIAVGGTVEWYFASGGHNVTSHPDAHNKCENPEGAEPFTSYEGDNHMAVKDVDSTYSHTFETPGEYTYVCVPHATTMVGYITVVENE